MSYVEVRDLVFTRGRRAMIIITISFSAILLTSLIGLRVGLNPVLGIGIMIGMLLAAWGTVKVSGVTRQELCKKCNFNIGQVIASLGKNTTHGYCPSCGNAID